MMFQDLKKGDKVFVVKTGKDGTKHSEMEVAKVGRTWAYTEFDRFDRWSGYFDDGRRGDRAYPSHDAWLKHEDLTKRWKAIRERITSFGCDWRTEQQIVAIEKALWPEDAK